MSWMRLATVAAGLACIGIGALVPAVAPVLTPAGVGIIGWAVPHPSDRRVGGEP